MQQNIRTLTVRQENFIIGRIHLHQMRQDHDEPVRAFSARLRGQAGVCCFKVKCLCGSEADYSEAMIRDVLIHGLNDDDIRLDVLSLKQDLTLEETLKFIEAK